MPALIPAEFHILPDWTIFIQLGIFVLAVAALDFFLFEPVLKLIDRRREFTDDSRAEVARLLDEAESLEAKRGRAIENALRHTAKERAHRIATARLEAERIIAEARLEARWFLSSTEMFIESSEESIAAEMNLQADMLSDDIISKGGCG